MPLKWPQKETFSLGTFPLASTSNFIYALVCFEIMRKEKLQFGEMRCVSPCQICSVDHNISISTIGSPEAP